MQRATSEYLQEKQHALEAAEARARALENEALSARAIRDNIIMDIALFHASQAPIAQMPLEVLPVIFEAWGDDTPRRNSTLSLVCKTWHAIVWNSAAFWTDIVMRPTWKVQEIDALCRFAGLCHRRSKEKLLDLAMDFSALIPYTTYIGRVLESNPRQTYFVPPFSSFSSIQHDSDDPEAQGDAYPFQHWYYRIPQGVMKRVVEENSPHIRRWRSIRIVMPGRSKHDVGHEILREMTGDMENLVQLEINGERRFARRELREIHEPIPNFPSIRRFVTTYDVVFDQIEVNYSTLEYLSLSTTHTILHFARTTSANFVGLRTLILDHDDQAQFETMVEPIRLPGLLSLKILGRIWWHQLLLRLDAPALVRLHLVERRSHPHFSVPVAPVFTQLESLFIQAEAAVDRIRGTIESVISCDALKSVMRQSHALVALRIGKDNWGDEENVKKLVREVWEEEKRSLRKLKDITIVHRSTGNLYGKPMPEAEFLTEDPSLLTVLQMSSIVKVEDYSLLA